MEISLENLYWIKGFKGLNGRPESEVPLYIHVKQGGI